MFNRKVLSTLLVSIPTLLFNQSLLATDNTQQLEQQSATGHTLTLNSVSGESCSLAIAKGDDTSELSLPLSAPCYWVTLPESTEAKSFAYPDQGISQVFLVAGTELNWEDEKKIHQKLPLETYCSEFLQGFVVKGDTAALAGDKLEAPICVGQNIDEKVFKGVALEADKQETTSANSEEAGETEEGIFATIKNTFSQLFKSEDKAED
ncbi:hypothetical protein EOL70_11970 [Leucothrix sargassi]|nr:hypothetical protein EOL70_11970 [Leucothrix sargassi]